MSEVLQPGADQNERRSGVGLTTAGRPHADVPRPDVRGTICIHHGGRAFTASTEQAAIFLRRVQQLLGRGESELIPLLHSTGVELLFVTARTPLQVHDSRDRSLTTGHTSAPAA